MVAGRPSPIEVLMQTNYHYIAIMYVLLLIRYIFIAEQIRMLNLDGPSRARPKSN